MQKTIESRKIKGGYYSRSDEIVNVKKAPGWWAHLIMHKKPSRWARIARREIGKHLREGEVWGLRHWNNSKLLASFVWINGVMFCKLPDDDRMGVDNPRVWTKMIADLQ